MTTMELTERIVRALDTSTLKEAANAAKLLRDGAPLSTEANPTATPRGLRPTYEERAAHLAGFASHHPRRLQTATEEFCRNLADLDDDEPVTYTQLDDPLLGSYVIWYVTASHEVVGCLYVIGKSEVPPEVWSSIWSDT